jgi:hypothetical protein
VFRHALKCQLASRVAVAGFAPAGAAAASAGSLPLDTVCGVFDVPIVCELVAP